MSVVVDVSRWVGWWFEVMVILYSVSRLFGS